MSTAFAELMRQATQESYLDTDQNTKSEADKQRVRRLATLDILMGLLMGYVAWRYNANESRMWLKVLTSVFAFFFWHLYGLYFLVRAGALRQHESILKTEDALKALSQAQAGIREEYTRFA